MSLSAEIVPHMFYMYWGRSLTGMLSWTNSLLLVLSMRNFFRDAMPFCQFYFSLYCSLEGRKNTVSWKTSSSLTWALSAGLGIFVQASLTLSINFSLRASGFYLFSTKSLTTNTICLGLYVPKSFKLSSRITSRIYSCAPLKVPICCIHILMRRVWEIAKANSEFFL